MQIVIDGKYQESFLEDIDALGPTLDILIELLSFSLGVFVCCATMLQVTNSGVEVCRKHMEVINAENTSRRRQLFHDHVFDVKVYQRVVEVGKRPICSVEECKIDLVEKVKIDTYVR